jgi:hypothetical protein
LSGILRKNLRLNFSFVFLPLNGLSNKSDFQRTDLQ